MGFLVTLIAALLMVAAATSSSLHHVTFLIKPNDMAHCPTELPYHKCLTLQSFASDSASFVRQSTTLNFIPGTHYLSSDLHINYTDTFIMKDISIDCSTVIKCDLAASLAFKHISVLHVKCIDIINCGRSVGAKRTESTKFDDSAVITVNVTVIQLISVKLLNSISSGMSVTECGSLTVSKTAISRSGNCGLYASHTTITFVNENTLSHNNGSAVRMVNTSLYLHGSTLFVGNTGNSGGAIWSINSTIFASDMTNFINNSAINDGGAIYSNGGGSVFIIEYSKFVHNTALNQNGYALTRGGGAIYARHISTLSINGSSLFQFNEAGYSGGGIFANDVTEVIVNGTLNFINNTAVARIGGAICARTVALEISGTLSFHNNTAGFGGGALDCEGTYPLTIKGKVKFINNTAHSAGLGGAIKIYHAGRVNFIGEYLFRGNRILGGKEGSGGAVWMQHNTIITLLANISFEENFAPLGGAVYAQYSKLVRIWGRILFVNNSAKITGGAMLLGDIVMFQVGGKVTFDTNDAFYGGALSSLNVTMKLDGSIYFLNNSAYSQGGALYALQSQLTLAKKLIFLKNVAKFGGALYITHSITYFLSSGVRVLLQNNTASQHGGGMYISDSGYIMAKCAPNMNFTDGLWPSCPFQYNSYYTNDIHLHFMGNAAKKGGSAIYGGALDACSNESEPSYASVPNPVNLNSIITITEPENSSDTIASDPNKVCSCSRHHRCQETSITRKIYPGQTITLPLVTVGQRDGIVPAVIQASLNTSAAKLGHLQDTQNTTITCSNLAYTMLSTENVTMTLGVAGTCSGLGQNLTVYIEFLPCPDGFELSYELKQCTCQWNLRQYATTCNINDWTIHRGKEQHFWVGHVNTSIEKGLILHPYCPFDYCTSEPVNFTLHDTDMQCHYNRSGILCGQCKPGFSLMLGASVCREDCSNAYLSLIGVFALAGLALVIFLFALRLTVTAGTVNGLIFYANIVHINRTLFFPSSQTNILTVFIAWINLDLGITTCFYREMDMYTRVWLQFVFPVYIWALCYSIILLSRRVPHIAAILGTNPVAVLATLFLVSYTKILRTVTETLSFTQVQYPHNNSRIVWLYDANVPLSKHLPLVVFSAVIFLLLCPYTLLLFANQWLLKWSDCRMFSWMNSTRVMFFLDAHNAPFKTRHRYWTGLLLIARLVVQLVFAANILGNPAWNILAVLVLAAFLLVWQSVLAMGSPYKNTTLGTVETLFIANLIFLAAGTYCASLTGGDINTPGYISAGVALATFMGIVLYHVYLRVKDKVHCRTRCQGQVTVNQDAGDDSLLEEHRKEDEDEDERLLDCSEQLQEEPPTAIGYTS